MPRKTPSTLAEVGYGGLKVWGGKVADEFHPNLQGDRELQTYLEMSSNDPIVGAILYTIESCLRKVEWEVEGPDEAEAEFLRSCMHDMEQAWEEFISDILSFLIYGHSLHETIYKLRKGPLETNPRYYSEHTDGRYGWRKHALRPQQSIDRWDLDPDTGDILGAWQRHPAAGVEAYLPSSRTLLFRTRTLKGNPRGRSILRTAYRPWFFKKKLEEIEAVGVARDLNGLPVIQIPAPIMSPSASAAQKAVRTSMEQMVSLIHRDQCEGIVMPSEFEAGESNVQSGYKLSLLSTNGGAKLSADPIIRRYDSRIAMSCAAEMIILGSEKQGSFALGAEKTSNFNRSLYWYLDCLSSTLNKVAVKRLYDVNNVPHAKRAKIVAGDFAAVDLQSLGLFLQAVTGGGLIHPTPAVESKLREFADLPEEDDALEELFAEEKAAEEAQAQLDAEVAMAGMQAAAAAPAGGPPKPGAKPGAGAAPKPKPGAKPAPKPKAKPK